MTYKTGVDLSRFQGVVDMDVAVTSGLDFLYFQAARGLDPDPKMNDYVAGLDRRRPFGLYHRFFPDQDIQKQIDLLVYAYAVLKPPMRPMYDIEDKATFDQPTLRTLVRLFVGGVDAKLATKGIIYTSGNFWNPAVNDVELGRDHLLWGARYVTTNPPADPRTWEAHLAALGPGSEFGAGGRSPAAAGWATWSLWQFSARGNGAAQTYGVKAPGDLDLDVCKAVAWPFLFMPGVRPT